MDGSDDVKMLLEDLGINVYDFVERLIVGWNGENWGGNVWVGVCMFGIYWM